jgi:DNA uptake protein ComE-like DNA-binding protein
LLAIFWLVLAVRWAGRRVYFSDDPDAPAPRAAELADRIDPNTCDWQTLAAIPSLGEKRARAIITFRDQALAAGQGPIIFHKVSDLTHVKGIGNAMADNLEPYLIFSSATQPSTKSSFGHSSF